MPHNKTKRKLKNKKADESFKKQALNFIRRLNPWRKREPFENFIFPAIKNIGNIGTPLNIIGVQPMEAPAGQVFFMDLIDWNSMTIFLGGPPPAKGKPHRCEDPNCYRKRPHAVYEWGCCHSEASRILEDGRVLVLWEDGLPVLEIRDDSKGLYRLGSS